MSLKLLSLPLALLAVVCIHENAAAQQPLAGPRVIPVQPVPQASREEQVVRDATAVLNEIMAVPAKQIPTKLLSDAHGIAIVPGVVKGGLVVGVRHGRGVVLTRDEQGQWQAPIFVSLTGGSVGWQIGIQSTDVILVFKSAKSIDGLMNGKLTIGVDAAASAGPVGRNAAAATDGRLQAEILSYSRSRGLFAGVAIDGSSIAVDRNAGAGYYQQFQTGPDGRIVQTPGVVPQSAVQLVAQLKAYTDGTAPVPAGGPAAPVPIAPGLDIDLGDASPPPGTIAAEPRPAYANASQSAVAASLNESHAKLMNLLDARWQAFLSLPTSDADSIDPKAWQAAAVRFDQVAANAQYQPLTSRAEFAATHRLVKDFAKLVSQDASVIDLPPPPE